MAEGVSVPVCLLLFPDNHPPGPLSPVTITQRRSAASISEIGNNQAFYGSKRAIFNVLGPSLIPIFPSRNTIPPL